MILLEAFGSEDGDYLDIGSSSGRRVSAVVVVVVVVVGFPAVVVIIIVGFSAVVVVVGRESSPVPSLSCGQLTVL
jgi:hypothetical protein